MARRVLANLDEALDNLTNLKELRRGLVRVAAPETLSCTLLPELIAGYGTSHPGVDVRFDDVPIQEVLAGLQNGSTDIGFGPAGVVPDQSVEVHMICADPLWVALRSDDPLAKGKSVSWKDLRERPLLNYMPNIAINVLSNVPPRHHPKELVPVHRVNTALSMLRVRQGAVICPSMAEPLVRGFGLTFLPLLQPAVKWKIAMFVPHSASLSPAVESFRDFTLDFSPNWAAGGQPPQQRTAQARVAKRARGTLDVVPANAGPIPDQLSHKQVAMASALYRGMGRGVRRCPTSQDRHPTKHPAIAFVLMTN